MKHTMNLFLILLAVFFLNACAFGPVEPAKWNYEKDAVMIRIKADRQLNLYGGKPHTIQLCIYQLKEPNAFNQLSGDEQGLYDLLECKLFDESVSTTKTLIIQPGKDLTFTLDRADGAKYIGIVAGYNMLDGQRITKLYDIPVIINKRGFIKRTKYYSPVQLSIDMTLGSQQIQKIGE
ncbi:MAG: type VI secretion system lipoprotein TssJ [Proteobacteria bacterium]|nr:type VI secretion system lipoprotein TssJ [Pseudomonadota bacterium]